MDSLYWFSKMKINMQRWKTSWRNYGWTPQGGPATQIRARMLGQDHQHGYPKVFYGGRRSRIENSERWFAWRYHPITNKRPEIMTTHMIMTKVNGLVLQPRLSVSTPSLIRISPGDSVHPSTFKLQTFRRKTGDKVHAAFRWSLPSTCMSTKMLQQ